jgi:indolepyruvate ferredoxin oxidoreductase, alpha subunit
MDGQSRKIMFLSGNEALAQAAFEEGLGFAASYPGTPATEILEYLSKFPEVDTQWSVNEKVAYEVALGASIAGARSLYASKHVGLNVAMDPLMTSAYVGVGGGFVVVSADDPGIHSSQNEQDNRLLARVAKIPLLEPSSPGEAYQFVKTAFAISEKFDTPVMIRLTTRIAHTKENVFIGPRKEFPLKEFKINIPKYVMVPKNAFQKHIELEARVLKLKAYSEKSALNKIEINDKKIGFITSGVSYLYCREIYPQASFLKLGMTFPFPSELARKFAKKVKKIIVVEELEPYLEEQLTLAGIKFKAKDPSFRVGELRPEDIPEIVKGKIRIHVPATSRKPVMCPGCPHRSVFSVLKKLRLTVTGDIGCYTLGALPPLGALHTCLCMGGGITMFEGLKKVLGQNVVGVIGDSTFVHSGITGLVNLAYNKTKGLVIILDNSTTAMTGNQPHPGVGITINGQPTKKLILEDLCRVCGADNVDVIGAYDIKALEELIKSRVNADVLSMIIVRTPCRLIDRTRLKPPVLEETKCKKCYICLGLDCPALGKDENGLIKINGKFCVGCNLCVNTCVPGALKKNE